MGNECSPIQLSLFGESQVFSSCSQPAKNSLVIRMSKPQKPKKKLEEIILFNHEKNFGFSLEKLKKGPYNLLKYSFYGLHDADVDEKIFEHLTPGENLCLLAGIGKTKLGNRHNSKSETPRDCPELIHYLIKVGREEGGYTHGFKDVISKTAGSQKQRISKLSEEEQRKFVRSYFSPHRVSNAEEGAYEKHDYIDPTCEGRGDRGRIDKKASEIYARNVYNYISGVYSDFKASNFLNKIQLTFS